MHGAHALWRNCCMWLWLQLRVWGLQRAHRRGENRLHGLHGRYLWADRRVQYKVRPCCCKGGDRWGRVARGHWALLSCACHCYRGSMLWKLHVLHAGLPSQGRLMGGWWGLVLPLHLMHLGGGGLVEVMGVQGWGCRLHALQIVVYSGGEGQVFDWGGSGSP